MPDARVLKLSEEDQLIEAGLHPRFAVDLDDTNNRAILLFQRNAAKFVAKEFYKVNLDNVRGRDIDQLFMDTMKLTFQQEDAEEKNS